MRGEHRAAYPFGQLLSMQIRRFVGWRAGACRLAVLAGLAPGLAACSAGVSGAGYPAVGGTAAVRLTATLADPLNVDLQWPANGGVDGYFVECAKGPREPFVLLSAVAPTVTTFRHAHLAPETTFLYRVRPYLGRVSQVVEIVAGEAEPASSEPVGADLVARSLSPTSVELRWKARNGADGYLIEDAATWREPFRAGDVVDADMSSHVVAGLTPHARHFFRVRAFSYGPPSNVVERSTFRKTSGNY
jgi:hypothetical protein